MKYYKLFLLFTLIFISWCSIHLSAKIYPGEESTLNFRIVGFALEGASKPNESAIEIAKGWYNNDDSFRRNIITTLPFTKNKIISEMPYWGCAYTWRITATGVQKNNEKTIFHHFRTGNSLRVNSEYKRMRIIKEAEKFKDAYIFSDINKVLYNMEGVPVWYLPDIDGIVNETSVVRNLRLTPTGSITMISGNTPVEIAFDGTVLWKAPQNNSTTGDTVEKYHHEFRKLHSGNYMVMGNETVKCEVQQMGNGDSVLLLVPNQAALEKGKEYVNRTLGTILEFDKKGKLIWSWKSSDHYKETRPGPPIVSRESFDNHENSFYFDENKKFLYVSYKNASEIIKIKYPDGKITNIYKNYSGTAMNTDNKPSKIMFSNQHSCKVSKKGYIYLFSNNMKDLNSPPSVVKLMEPVSGHGSLKKIWEYQYPVTITDKPGILFTNGGNVVELPDQSDFVSMCHPFGNVFIVSAEKKILWEAILEKWNPLINSWEEESEYRGSIISNNRAFQKLLWNHGTNEQKLASNP